MPAFDEFDDDDYEPARDDDEPDEGCVLGARCCCPHMFHSSSECYDAEWAEDYFKEQAAIGSQESSQ